MKKRISALFLTLLLAFALCLPAAADSEMAYLFDVSDALSYLFSFRRAASASSSCWEASSNCSVFS